MADASVRVPCPVCSVKVKVTVDVNYSHDGTTGRVGLIGSVKHVCAEKP